MTNRISEAQGFEYAVNPFQRTRPNVAIVGFTAHRDEALKLDPKEWEIWGLNELHRYMPPNRFHRWFEIHPREALQNDPGGSEHLADLAKFQIPVYMHQHWPDIPASLPFPVDEIVEGLGRDYFTCCPAWMIGFAIALGFERIHVYGVDMASDTEYATQRNCCEYWLGVAEGRGVEIMVPDTSDLLKCVGRYGFGSEGSQFVQKLKGRMKWLHQRDSDIFHSLKRLEGEYRTKHNNLLGILERAKGAIGELRQHRQTDKCKARIAELEAEIAERAQNLQQLEAQFEEQRTKLSNERMQVIGGLQDCNFWHRSWGITAPSGGANQLPDRSLDPRTGIQAPSVDSKEPAPAESLEVH